MIRKVKYYVKTIGEDIEDAKCISDEHCVDDETIKDEDVMEIYAEDAAKQVWKDQDGWMETGDVVITLVVDNAEIGDFNVEVDVQPVFTARRVGVVY